MTYFALENLAQDKNLSSSGSILTIGEIFLSVLSSAISKMPVSNSSLDVRRFSINEENLSRFKTLLSSFNMLNVKQIVKSPFSASFKILCGLPRQKNAEIRTLVSRTTFIFSLLFCLRVLLLRFLLMEGLFLVIFQLFQTALMV